MIPREWQLDTADTVPPTLRGHLISTIWFMSGRDGKTCEFAPGDVKRLTFHGSSKSADEKTGQLASSSLPLSFFSLRRILARYLGVGRSFLPQRWSGFPKLNQTLLSFLNFLLSPSCYHRWTVGFFSLLKGEDLLRRSLVVTKSQRSGWMVGKKCLFHFPVCEDLNFPHRNHRFAVGSCLCEVSKDFHFIIQVELARSFLGE